MLIGSFFLNICDQKNLNSIYFSELSMLVHTVSVQIKLVGPVVDVYPTQYDINTSF